MEIIFGKENADKLKDRYVLLELESISISEVNEKVELYCVVPTDKIAVDKLADLPRWIKLHEDFLRGYNNKEYEYCLQCIDYLTGQFAGELDTFYDEIKYRIESLTK